MYGSCQIHGGRTKLSQITTINKMHLAWTTSLKSKQLIEQSFNWSKVEYLTSISENE
jgi:hypothetical protein